MLYLTQRACSTVFFDMLNGPNTHQGETPIRLAEDYITLETLAACMEGRAPRPFPTVALLAAVAKAQEKYDISILGYVIREETRRLIESEPYKALELAGVQGDVQLAKGIIKAFEAFSDVPSLTCNSCSKYQRSGGNQHDHCCCDTEGLQSIFNLLSSLDHRTGVSLLAAMFNARLRIRESSGRRREVGWEAVAEVFVFFA